MLLLTSIPSTPTRLVLEELADCLWSLELDKDGQASTIMMRVSRRPLNAPATGSGKPSWRAVHLPRSADWTERVRLKKADVIVWMIDYETASGAERTRNLTLIVPVIKNYEVCDVGGDGGRPRHMWLLVKATS